MAIDNYIDKITKDGESRMISPAADKVRVENEHYEGDNLDDVLDEIDEKVSQAVPTKTSQLQNDSGFITAEDVPSGETDSAMSSTSERPVQNKVIKAYVDSLIQGLIDGAPAALDTLKKLATALGNNSDAYATLINLISSKANASEVYSKSQVDAKVADAGKVKSVSVNNGTPSQPDAQTGNVNISVPSMTDISDAFDDAISEAQVTVVPAESVGIIDGMGSTSTTDALSANMGKVLKAAILTLFGSLGNYCFPAGRPTLILDGSSTVSFSVTYSNNSHVEFDDGEGEDAPTTADLLDTLTVHLSTDGDLYVIKESSVKVYMGGNEVTGAYDPTTDTITVNNVVGNVVIVAEAWTYVSRGLVMHLDGRNRGGTAGKWKSLVDYNNSPLYFKLENCDEQSDYVGFDKDDNSCGIAYSDTGFQNQVTLLDVPAASGTIECAATGMDEVEGVCIMHNNIGQGNRILFSINKITDDSTRRNVAYCTSPLSTATNGGKLYATGVKQGYFSALSNSVKVNGIDMEMLPVGSGGTTSFIANASSYLALLRRHAESVSPVDSYYSANLYVLRVYSVQLTDAERAQNLAIDRKRFNLGY